MLGDGNHPGYYNYHQHGCLLMDKTERSADRAEGGREEGGKETMIQIHGKLNYMIQLFIGKGTYVMCMQFFPHFRDTSDNQHV